MTGFYEGVGPGTSVVPHELNDHEDATVTTPSGGQFIIYNATTAQWENSNFAAALNDLTDVAVSTPVDGHILVFNAATLDFENGFLQLNDLGDVVLTSPVTGNLLRFQNSQWENIPEPGDQQTKIVDYQLTLDDVERGRMIIMNAGTALNLTVPDDATVGGWPSIGSVGILQLGAGQVTVVASGSTVIRTPETLKLRAQYSTAALILTGTTDEWVLVGDIEEAP